MLRSALPLLLCLGAAAPWMGEEHQEDYKHGRRDAEPHSDKAFCSWKCLKFTLQWPGGFCVSLDSWSHCRIPLNIHNWTIHGLWPQRALDCCRCWPIFHSDVQELEAELDELWPSLLKTKSSFLFWKQEWDKHGVCAACVEGMNSPLRYFQISLKLRGQFDIHKALDAAGIRPSCQQPYKLSEVQSVLAPVLGDQHEIQCVTDDKDREVWFQVKIPLSHNLTVGCDHKPLLRDEPGPGRSFSPGHPCPAQLPLFYFPIDHQQPHRPCG
ncbi:ribonuclease T2-like [Centroberyx gerrardi]